MTGKNQMSKHVFEGVKVADFTVGAVGTVATKYLADHGATVLHVESATAPEVCRAGPPFRDNKPGLNRSAWMPDYNSNKYGIGLNLRHPRANEVARRIVAWADIVSNNRPAGQMERYGLGYEDIKKIKPDIIMFVSCMQGHTGPHREHPGYGTQLAALSGFTHLSGWPDRLPSEIWLAYTDFICPRYIGATLIAALDYRRRTGKGQFLDFSQFEMGIQFIAPLLLDYTVNGRIANRRGNDSSCGAPHGAYPCRGEDRWCAIAVFTDEEWESLCRVIGNPEWTNDPRFSTLVGRLQNKDELDRFLGEWTINFTAEEVMTLMQAAGVSAGVLETNEDLHNDPQLKHRRHFWIMDHREIGPMAHDGEAFILSKTPYELRWAGPCLGEHNEYVYTEILGMSEKEFDELLVEGVFE